MVGVAFREFVEEDLQASVVHPRQIKRKALSGRWLHRRVQVGPLVGASHDVGRAKPFRAVAPRVPVDEPETRLVEGHHHKRLSLLAVALAYLLDLPGEVFWKASCVSGSAFSWRGRPVLSLTLRRLRSWPTSSGCEYSMPWRSLRNSSA